MSGNRNGACLEGWRCAGSLVLVLLAVAGGFSSWAARAAEGGADSDASSSSAPPDTSWLPDMHARMNAVLSDLQEGVEDRGPFNPDNRIAWLPQRAKEAELRVDVRIKARDCDALVKPRLRWSEANVNELTPRESETFFNTALLKCRLGGPFDASIGRQSLQWGNGQFRSPSNPFFAESVRFNPVQEIMGRDFVVLSYQPSLTWRASYIAHVGNSHLDTTVTPFERSNALKVDWTGDSAAAGVLASQRHAHPARLSGYGTVTWSDSTLFYTEATTSRDAEGLLPLSVGGNVVAMAPASLVEDRRRYSILAGSAYTFESGVTLYAEYLRSTEGYSAAQARDWLGLARNATAALAGPGAGQAMAQLTSALDPGWRQLRNNYLFLQLVRTEYKNRADIALRAVRNLDDHGSMLAASLTLNLGDHAQWFVFATRNLGGPETEFGRMQRYAFQTGLRLYAF